MGLDEILEAAEGVGERDETRQEVFRSEFRAYEEGETATFDETRAAISAERSVLETLAAELEHEDSSIEELIEDTDFLTVEQAVRHRDASVEKLREHNEKLREFHAAMVAALDAVEENLDSIEREGLDAIEADPEPHFQRAHEALTAHNEAVEGLDKNMTILNAYLL